jgi:hypothetical protein
MVSGAVFKAGQTLAEGGGGGQSAIAGIERAGAWSEPEPDAMDGEERLRTHGSVLGCGCGLPLSGGAKKATARSRSQRRWRAVRTTRIERQD